MPPAPAKPITAAEFYDTLLDTDRIVATRTAANQPDITKRVGLLPPVALVDYLAGRLYRGGNNAGVPVKVVDFYDPTEPGFDPLKHSALTTLDPAFLCLKTRCIIVNPRPNQPGEYVLEYNTFSAATMRVWRDGRFSQSGQQSDAQWYAVKSPEAAAPEWASLQAAPPVASYNFPVKYLLRHPFAGNQLFFETKVAGVLPAPSLADGDANYLRVARETVPVIPPAGATPWRVGYPVAAGEFKYNSATPPVLFYAKAAIVNPQVEPFLAGSTAQANALYEQVGGAAGTAYVLPVASPTVLGGVLGAGGTLTGNVVVNADRSMSAPSGGAGPATTDGLPEGVTNKYYLDSRAALKANLVGGKVPLSELPQLGATAWTAGQPIAAGQLKFNSAAVLFYAKAAIANPQAEPFTVNSSNAVNALYQRAFTAADGRFPEWTPSTAFLKGQIVQAPVGFATALYVSNADHTSPVLSTGVDFFSEALTDRWQVVSRTVRTAEIIASAGESRSLLPALLSQQIYRTPATGTFTLLADTTASGRTKTGEAFTIVITQSRTGGVTFDAGTFANQPRLSGAGGTDILRFYTDAAGKLFCWSDGQGLVGGTSTPAAAGSGDTFAALTPTTGSIALDFNAATVQTLGATGNVAFTTANVAQLKTKELYITNTTGAAITLSCPAGWSFFPGPAPTSLAASKQAVLTLRAVGADDSTVKAAYVAQA